MTVGWITTCGTALLACLVAFGIPFNNTQQAALLGLLPILAPVIVMLVGRSKVFSPATVRALVKQARNESAKALPTTRNTGVFDGPRADGPREI
jgi:hypothetical protein